MDAGKITLSRKELYEQVWAESMVKLAARYGLSDVGLAKICKRNKIPRPSLGYWARKQFGYAVKQEPLPEKEHNLLIEIRANPFKTKPFNPESPILKLVRLEKQPGRKIIVPNKLINPHPLIIKTTEIMNFIEPDHSGKIISPSEDCLDMEIPQRDLPRALLILDSLIKAIEERGYEVLSSDGRTKVKILNAWVRFILKGQSIRTPLEPKNHKLDGYYEFGYNQTELRPDLPGKLRLEIITGYQYNLGRHSWGDTPARRLEDLLNEFMGGLLKAAAAVMESNRHRRQEENEEKFHPYDQETGKDV
jgi:hypothetical protein